MTDDGAQDITRGSAHDRTDDTTEHRDHGQAADRIDATIRDGLQRATFGLGDTTAGHLAAALAQRRAQSQQRHRRRARYGAFAAVAALVAAVVGAGVWITHDDATVDVVANEPTTTPLPANPFGGYEPGWHEIDPGPVEAMNGALLAWTGSEIVVAGDVGWVDDPQGPGGAGGTADPSADTGPQTRAYAYDPASREWRQLPDPPVANPTVVATDHTLVAVGLSMESAGGFGDDWVWATLEASPDGSGERQAGGAADGAGDGGGDGDGQATAHWTPRGSIEMAPELSAAGASGPTQPNGRPTLLWTGERVIDVTHGTVLDPASGKSTPLAMPSSVVNYTHLVSSNAVWTGEEVVLVAWNGGDGLAWDATGESFRTVAGLPEAKGSNPHLAIESTAVGGDGRAALMEWTTGASPPGRTAVLDVATGTWSRPPDRPTSPDRFYCPMSAAFVGGELVVEDCTGTDTDPGPPVRLEGDSWVSLGGPPWTEGCCMGTWLGTDDALVTWATDNDTTNNPEAPYVRGAIWIPGGEGEPVDAGDRTTSTRAGTVVPTDPGGPGQDRSCRLEALPDLGQFLPTQFDRTPQRGIGGMPDSADLCARFWGTPRSPAIHVTQRPGESLYGMLNVSASGRYRWGAIEDGYGIEFTGEPTWSTRAYGLDEADFDGLVKGLLAGEDTTAPVTISLPGPEGGLRGSDIESIDHSSRTDGWDFLTVGFSGEPPARIDAAYAEEPVWDQCDPVPLDGTTFLNVRMAFASLAPSLRPSEGGGPVRIPVAAGSSIRSITLTCVFEGNAYLSIGMDAPAPVEVQRDVGEGTVRIVFG